VRERQVSKAIKPKDEESPVKGSQKKEVSQIQLRGSIMKW
jgi:hypothetical protein